MDDIEFPIKSSIFTHLKTVREEKGFTQNAVAENLKLSVRQIEYLEAGNIEKLSGRPFARGFVRSYARFLGLDVNAALAAFDAEYAPPPSVVTQTEVESTAQQKVETEAVISPVSEEAIGKNYLKQAIVAALLLGGALFLWGVSRPSSPPVPVSDSVPLPPPVAQVESPKPTPVVPTAAPAPVSTPIAPASTPSPSLNTQSPPSSSVPPSTPIPTSDKPLVLDIKQGQSWIEISDATGKRLVSGLQKEGDHHALEGTAPYKIKIGNAQGVQLTYKGKPVSLEEYTTGGSVARFKLE